jgi:hypothetical protein
LRTQNEEEGKGKQGKPFIESKTAKNKQTNRTKNSKTTPDAPKVQIAI